MKTSAYCNTCYAQREQEIEIESLRKWGNLWWCTCVCSHCKHLNTYFLTKEQEKELGKE